MLSDMEENTVILSVIIYFFSLEEGKDKVSSPCYSHNFNISIRPQADREE